MILYYVFQTLLNYILQNEEYSIYRDKIYDRSHIVYLVQRIE